MKEYQKRVIVERSELKVKYNKLGNFINDGASPTLTAGKEAMENDELTLMQHQHIIMGEYIDTLTARIALFK